MKTNLLVGLFLLVCVLCVHGMVNKLKIARDNRDHFLIETFGFNVGGRMEFEVNNFKVYSQI